MNIQNHVSKDYFTKIVLSSGHQIIAKLDAEHKKLQDLAEGKVVAA